MLLDKTKTSIAKALYASICDFFFLKDGINTVDIGVTLHCTVSKFFGFEVLLNTVPTRIYSQAYMLLSDAATLHHGNQSRLRDERLLGAWVHSHLVFISTLMRIADMLLGWPYQGLGVSRILFFFSKVM